MTKCKSLYLTYAPHSLKQMLSEWVGVQWALQYKNNSKYVFWIGNSDSVQQLAEPDNDAGIFWKHWNNYEITYCS